jgi:3-oxoacyl-[acyl-carrier protein] reductase
MTEDDEFRGRVALVTGGSGGIGRALCEQLARRGAAVAVGYASGAAAAHGLVERLRGTGARAVAVGGDLGRPEAAARLVAEAEAGLGPVDVLVANAATNERDPWDEVSLESWDRVMAVNLRAPFLLAQCAAPGMVERRWGRILFVSSTAAFTGGSASPSYGASKAGLHGLCHHLARRLAATGVTVNVLASALIADTAMLPGGPELADRVPVGRLGRPDEVARLAVAMLDNGYLTSQVVNVDGGVHPR